MSLEEKRLQARLILKRNQAKAMLAGDAAPEVPEGEGLDLQDIRGGAQQIAKGALAGFGDEALGAYQAAVTPWTDALGGDFSGLNPMEYYSGFGDRYTEYRDKARAVDEEFERENPKTALGLNLGSSVFSPLSKVGAAAKPGRVAQILRGGAEGAAAGVGESDADLFSLDTLMDAGIGGGTGAGITAGLGTAGRFLGRTPGISDLDTPEGFKPLPLADEGASTAARIYRNTFGRSSAAPKLQAQEAPWLERAAETVEAERLDLNKRKRALEEDLERQKANIDEQKAYNIQQEQVDVPTTVAGDKVDPRATPAARQFRQTAAVRAIPEGQADEAFKDVDMSDVDAVDDAIADWWSKNGFQMVKERPFNLQGSKLRKELDKFGSIPEVRLEMNDVVEDVVMKRLRAEGRLDILDAEDFDMDQLIYDELSAGSIQGDVLMALRNKFATGANKATGLSKGQLRQIANRFDNFIRDNLDDDAVAEFDKHIDTYPASIAHGKAVQGNAANLAGGQYLPKEYLAAGKQSTKRGAGKRKRPLQNQSRAAQAEVDAQAAKETADNSAQEAARGLNQTVKSNASKIAKEQKLQLNNRGRRARDILREEANTGPLGRAKVEVDKLAGRATPKGVSGLSERLQDRQLGQMATGSQLGMLGNIVVGIGTAAGGTTKPAQRMVAGQSAGQKAAQWTADQLRRLTKEEQIIEMMNRGLSRAAALEMVD